VFGTAETLSNTLQGKDTLIQEAMTAVNLAKNFNKSQRKEEAFMTELQSLQIILK